MDILSLLSCLQPVLTLTTLRHLARVSLVW